MRHQSPLTAFKSFQGCFTVMLKNPDESYEIHNMQRISDDEYHVNQRVFDQKSILEYVLKKHVCYIASDRKVWTALDRVTKTIQKSWRTYAMTKRELEAAETMLSIKGITR